MLKSLVTIIIAHIIGTGGTGTKVYEAPIKTAPPTPSVTITINAPTTIATSSVKAKQVPVAKPISKSPKLTPVKIVPKKIEPTPTPTRINTGFILPQVDFEKANSVARLAIVNILCTTKGNELSPISGTGVVISPKGVIITNAHIGQYLLLKDYREKDYVDCKIRVGSPAYPTYNVELMYISPTWVKNNIKVLTELNPTGTGENDFAFLHITGKIDGQEMPARIPFIIPDIRELILRQEPVMLISYPAGFLGGLSILQHLNIASSITTIKDYFTYTKDTIDILDVGGTILSQKGSSGGAVVDSYLSLLGLITTSSEAKSTDQRELRAITLAHVNRALISEVGFGIDKLLTSDPSNISSIFASTTAPLLTKILIDSINN